MSHYGWDMRLKIACPGTDCNTIATVSDYCTKAVERNVLLDVSFMYSLTDQIERRYKSAGELDYIFCVGEDYQEENVKSLLQSRTSLNGFLYEGN